MKIKRHLFVILFIFGALLLSGCLSNDDSQLSYGEISGRIVYLNDDGEIIEEDWAGSAQTVHIKNTDLVVESNLGGTFRLKNVPAGNHSLEVIYHGYPTETMEFSLKSGEKLVLKDIEIQRDYGGPVKSKTYLYLNNNELDLNLRKAIFLALDKDEIVHIVQDHYAADSKFGVRKLNQFIPFTSAGYNDDFTHIYDLEASKKIVADNNFADKKVTVYIHPHNKFDNLYSDLGQYITSQLAQINLDVEMVEIPFEDLVERVTNTFEYQIIIVATTISNQKSPLPGIHGSLCTDGSVRFIGIEQSVQTLLDSMFAQAKLKYDRAEFDSTITKIQKLALDNYVSLPLYQTYEE